MKRILTYGIGFLILLTALSCQTANSVQTPEPTAVKLENGKSAIIGVVQTNASGNEERFPNIGIRLAMVIWNEDKSDGKFILEGATSPGTFTEDDGSFALVNIDPGDYVLVVGDVFQDHVIISNPDGSAVVYTADEGEVTDIGVITVSLEP